MENENKQRSMSHKFRNSSSSSESANEEFEFEITKHPIQEQYTSTDVEKYVTAFKKYDSNTNFEKVIQHSKQDLFKACMSGFGKMPDYFTRKDKCDYVFNISTMVKMNYDLTRWDMLMPTEKFPFGAIFTCFGKAGFAAILENGTYYISCNKLCYDELKEDAYMDAIVKELQNTARDAQNISYRRHHARPHVYLKK